MPSIELIVVGGVCLAEMRAARQRLCEEAGSRGRSAPHTHHRTARANFRGHPPRRRCRDGMRRLSARRQVISGVEGTGHRDVTRHRTRNGRKTAPRAGAQHVTQRCAAWHTKCGAVFRQHGQPTHDDGRAHFPCSQAKLGALRQATHHTTAHRHAHHGLSCRVSDTRRIIEMTARRLPFVQRIACSRLRRVGGPSEMDMGCMRAPWIKGCLGICPHE